MGTWETMIILVIALVFLGPDKLPEVARSIGKGLRTLRRAMSSVEYEVRSMTEPDRFTPPPRNNASHVNAEHETSSEATTDGHDEADPNAPPEDYDFHAEPQPAAPNAPEGAVAAAHPLRSPPADERAEGTESHPEHEVETS